MSIDFFKDNMHHEIYRFDIIMAPLFGLIRFKTKYINIQMMVLTMVFIYRDYAEFSNIQKMEISSMNTI